LLQLGFEGLGFNGSWMASLDGKLGWARLTDTPSKVHKIKLISKKREIINQDFLALQEELSSGFPVNKKEVLVYKDNFL
jgi:hypothetical protein